MKEVFDFLKKSGVFYLATCDGDKPKVRPFGAINIFEDKLYFQTGRSKEVAKQININSNVAISSMYEGKWIRLEGTLVEDNRIVAKESMLDNNPELKSLYRVDDDNNLVLYIKDAKASICSFTEPPKVIEF